MTEDLEQLIGSAGWKTPAGRELALWLVTLAAPAGVLWRPAWALAVAYHAITRRRRMPRA